MRKLLNLVLSIITVFSCGLFSNTLSETINDRISPLIMSNTFTETFTTAVTAALSKIDSASTNLTVLTASRTVRIPYYPSFTNLSASLSGAVNSAVEDDVGNCMFATGAGKVYYYDGSIFTNYSDQGTYDQTSPYLSGAFNGDVFLFGGSSVRQLLNLAWSNGIAGAGDDISTATTGCSSFNSITAVGSNGSYCLVGATTTSTAGSTIPNAALNKFTGWPVPLHLTDLTPALNASGAFAGTAFTEMTGAQVPIQGIETIVWNGSYWLIGGSGGNLAKYDGSTFTNISSGATPTGTGFSTHAIRAIAWNGSYWLIGGGDSSASNTSCNLVKYNGTTFTDLTTQVTNATIGGFASNPIAAITWMGDRWAISTYVVSSKAFVCLYDGAGATSLNYVHVGSTPASLTSLAYTGNQSIRNLTWNGSYLLIGGGDGASVLYRANGIYTGLTPLTITSKQVNTETNRITSVQLSTTDTNTSSLTYQASCDGGTNWKDIKNDNVINDITYTGSSLKWRAIMSGVWVSPTIATNLTLTYLTCALNTIPANDSGDVLYNLDAGTKLSVPSGAVTVDTTFTFTKLAAASNVSSVAPKTAYIAFSVTAANATSGAVISTFAKPLTLTIHGNAANGIDVAKAKTGISLAYWNGLHWIPISSIVTIIGNEVYVAVKLNHLSTYGIVAHSPTDIAVTVEPNPFTPGSANPVFNTVKFSFPNTGSDAVVINIWDRQGSLICKLTENATSQIFWDGKDSAGNGVESGVYIYEVRVGLIQKARGTVVVGR